MKEKFKYWITTDTHFGHSTLVEKGYRPSHFGHMFTRGMTRIKPDDIFIHLGDICIGDDEFWNEWLTLGHHKKILVRGNHDHKSDSWYYEHGWDFVCDSFTLEKYGKKILFSHEPVRDHGCDLNIHGHWHDNDHRWHPEFAEWYNPKKYYRLAIEETNYAPVTLLSLVAKNDKIRAPQMSQ